MFELSKNHKKCRVWLNDSPEMHFNVIEKIEETFCPNVSYLEEEKRIIIELSLPRNCSNYAMLGVLYIPNESGLLNVQVNISDFEDTVFIENIACSSEKVFFGIPKEFAPGILNFIRHNTSSLKLPSGKLVFEIGAYGLVGSSISIFSTITEILLKLLT